jgi:hypothetical protein
MGGRNTECAGGMFSNPVGKVMGFGIDGTRILTFCSFFDTTEVNVLTSELTRETNSFGMITAVNWEKMLDVDI